MSLSSNSVLLVCPSLVRGCSLWREVFGVYSSADPTLFPGLLIWKPPRAAVHSAPCSPLSLSPYLFISYAFTFGYCPEIVKSLQPAQPVGTRPGTCPVAVQQGTRGKESVGIRGATLQAGCQTPCAAPALVLFLCPFSLQPSQDRGGMGRAFPRIVMAEFCQEGRNFVLMQPRHHSKPNTQTSGNWRNVRFSQQS